MNIKQSTVLKAMSYILIPIFGAIIVLTTIYSIYVAEFEKENKEGTFYQTERFADMYKSNLYNIIELVEERKETFDKVDVQENIYYGRYYDYNYHGMLKYIVLNTKTNTAYTNITVTENTNTIDKLKQNVKNENNQYLCYTPNPEKVETNIPNEELQNLNYVYLKNALPDNSTYEIYTYINPNRDAALGTVLEEIVFEISKKFDWIPVAIMPVLIIAIFAMLIYLCFAIGHVKGHEGIYLNRFEKWPIELTGIISFIVFVCGLAPTTGISFVNMTSDMQIMALFSFILIFAIIAYIALAVFATIVIKKLKTGTLINSSFTYKIIKKIISGVKKLWHNTFDNVDLNAKIIIAFIGLILLSIILISTGGLGVLIVLALWSYVLYLLQKKANEFRLVKNTTKEIYEGDVDNRIDEEKINGELKELSKYINDISGGFSNAIEQNLKSERLKTELITNVSHDIKTPLTSIINYVDLLKQENIENEKANEYLQILDAKSQRLKKLIEDLIEASKVSSGNIKLNIEKIDVVELTKQAIGEFEDKFKQKGLEIITTMPENEVTIEADSRYMYRVVDNIYSNIAKYALDNSRVYIDIKVDGKQVLISFKNISKEKLNISIDELMERFVRGDKSRTTEGSGLGLSISKSLTELQNGKFDVQVDGDLFKVELVFTC